MRKYIFGITLLLLAGISTSAQETKSVTTRFGALTVSDAGVLLFKGSPVQPTIEANNSLDLGESFQIGASDLKGFAQVQTIIGLNRRLDGTTFEQKHSRVTHRQSAETGSNAFGLLCRSAYAGEQQQCDAKDVFAHECLSYPHEAV